MPGYYVIVNEPAARLYADTCSESMVVDEALYGMKVLVLNENDSWYRVRTHYHYEGFIRKEASLADGAIVREWEDACKCTVISSFADIMQERSYSSRIIKCLCRGGMLRVSGSTVCNAVTCKATGKRLEAGCRSVGAGAGNAVDYLSDSSVDGWLKAGLCDGQTGYIRRDHVGGFVRSLYFDDVAAQNIGAAEYLMLHYGMSQEHFRAELVKNALWYMETPYRWGGKSPIGIDCSGLCSIAYMLTGITIYRDAKLIEGYPVHRVAMDRAGEGDLLYFPGHIAMYLGNGRYIHSTGREGCSRVVINSLNPGESGYRADLKERLLYAGSIF